MGTPRMDLIAGFWARIDTTDGPEACWPWRGETNRKGYGVFHNGRQRREESVRRKEFAHRLAFAMGTGQDPRGWGVLHRGNRPTCCTPAHLYLGSNADNMRDTIRAGQHCFGARNPNAKVTDDDIRRIRASSLDARTLAAIFGLGRNHILDIRRGEYWSHVA